MAKIKDLRPAHYNPRKISPAQLERLGVSMVEFGDLSVIVFNRRTGLTVGGHQRVKKLDPEWPITFLAQAEEGQALDVTGTVAWGYISTPRGWWLYREVDWDEARERAANIAANQNGGEFDLKPLKEILSGLDTGDGLLELAGFADRELDFLMERGSPPPAPPAPEDAGAASAAPMFEQMTFVLTPKQATAVRVAIAAAIRAGHGAAEGNEDGKSNALAGICQEYADRNQRGTA